MKTLFIFLITVLVLALAASPAFVLMLEHNQPSVIIQKVTIEEDYSVYTGSKEVTQYKLVSTYCGRTITDIGTAKEIDSLKCLRATQLIFDAKTLKELNKPCQ